jgi:hypothetical protein
MNVYVMAILAWVGFSPVFGVAVGTMLRRAGRRPRALGDPFLNHGRPHGLPCVVANQVVPFKRATSRTPA